MFLVSQATFPGQPQSEIAALYRLHYIWPTASDERVEREIQILSPSTQTPDAFSAELDAALQVADEVQKAVALREVSTDPPISHPIYHDLHAPDYLQDFSVHGDR